MLRKRHFYRYNPVEAEVCKTTECGKGANIGNGFESLEDARGYNKFVFPHLTGKDCDPRTPEGERHAELHRIACEMEQRADIRNINRKLKRAKKRLKDTVPIPEKITFRELTNEQASALARELKETIPTLSKMMALAAKKRTIVKRAASTSATSAAASSETVSAAPLAERDYWEVIRGPNYDEFYYFFVKHRKKDGVEKGAPYKKGDFWKREPAVTRRPKTNDIILDLTNGIKAWIKTKRRRRPIDVSEGMMASYKNSYLYKVRCLAARAYAKNAAVNLRKFLEDVNSSENNSNKSKKIKKNKKNKRKKRRK
jgi:hypothetical protein